MNKKLENMDKKIIRLTESDLHRIVKESVNRALKEYHDIDDDRYFGGGLPSHFNDDEVLENDRITEKQILELDNFSKAIAEIANNTSDDTDLLFQASDCIDKFTAKYKH